MADFNLEANIKTRIEKALIETMQNEIFKDLIIDGKNLTYIRGYLQEQNLRKKIENLDDDFDESEDSYVPFVLLRTHGIKQNNDSTPVAKYLKLLIRIVIKTENVEDGYDTVENMANRLVDYLTAWWYTPNYQIKFDAIETKPSEDANKGDYFGYDILLLCKLPVNPPTNYMKLKGY